MCIFAQMVPHSSGSEKQLNTCKVSYSVPMVWYGMEILFHLGKPLAMKLLFKAPRAVQTQAVNLTYIGKSRSSRVISHGDIPTHGYNTASREVAFFQLKCILSIWML